MTNKLSPSLSRTVLAASIAAIWVAGHSAAWAQDADEIRSLTRPGNTVELGVGFTNANSFKFGDYTGMNDKGAYLISNVELNHRNEANTHYFSLTGLNLGLDSRNLKLEGGEQGNYGLSLEYDEIPKLSLDSYQTPFLNPGTANLTLPTPWVRGATTGAMAGQIDSNMRPFDIKTERNSLSFGLTKELARGWDAVLRVKREKRDGSRLIGAVMGNSGGNPRAALLPEPIDYTTDELEAQLRYTDKKLQLQFAYFGSYFDNANSSLTWSNPFAASVWANASTAQGQIGLPPDNRAHQISAAGGYTITPDTRLSGSVSLGRMTQNDAFLPYTINSGLTSNVALPRTSLDGRVDTSHVDVKLSSKLTPKLHASAGYRYDERDNKTPQARYRYIGGDSENQAAANSAKDRTNLPGSSTKQQIEAHLDYHLTPDTKLKFGYDYEWAEKTFEAITEEKEHTVKAEVNQHFSDMVSGGLSYAYSDRKTRAANGSDYDASAPFLASFTPAYAIGQFDASLPLNGYWDNLPAQYKFFMAPRKRDKVRAFLNVTPTDKIDLQAAIDYKNDDFHKSQYGLQKAKGWAVNLDANYVVSDTLTGHVFASFDKYTTGQRTYAFNGGSRAITGGVDWTADIDDRTTTFGIGARYTPSSKYQIGGDITHAASTGTTSVLNATNTTGAMPDLKTKLTRLDLFGQYQIQKNLTVKMKYIYERYSSADWSIDQVTATTMANVIGTNQTSPQYDVHFLGVSLAYDF
ncbi:MtrB/PioB family decaheme-associated outer membrane protein [Rhodoferax sp. U2-2l]|uniref:MtrB/PioB family decaheme-associated outer membrane protein n=1 Tax=Rhodoferax sp. U2-2l TaxID=2884000 RepID=UPI001D0AF4F5|nr:MtrB/PioB family decaheme-associated outer membrane protein [Rhodoferax sp. U2-2l]MCB8747430.1 MtrB/PioB family decaheme-associated outer membrane protein [Rhodoferax sp. U2-2l]